MTLSINRKIYYNVYLTNNYIFINKYCKYKLKKYKMKVYIYIKQ